MKIEMGESLMLSWLRHVKTCQSVQLNWKPSTASWELHNEEIIEKIMYESSKFYQDKYDLNIYKNNKSHTQLLQQGEIDVLGLKIKNAYVENIYAIDIAFHEAGLNYGNTKETIERVLKKMTRTAMILHGYFNMKLGNIIFASPKINKVVFEPLLKCVSELKEIFMSLNLDFKFVVYANDEFQEKIFNPVISLSKSIADTSELFLRSIQLYNMFSNQSITSNRTAHSEASQINTVPVTGEDKIGTFVRNQLRTIIQSGSLPIHVIKKLCDKEYCKSTFDLNYSLLKKVNEEVPINEQRLVNGYYRYWSEIFTYNDEKYFVCNDWYERNRTHFIRWLENIEIEKNLYGSRG
ncbi:hypothetical protein G3578_00045 [Brevibacillus sp. SYP-B805]|uniref:hypothetical protein n=1 Tax=Brevibacillus sp. SYP-B805 TaxID=1578199 RepID=UPI0013ECD05A|nr:hypothetical protein [Brevibacillus sp. SYP-B805]NGQ93569.1 hypothetical protein [Brevibacillus sp. SYP-B805]